MTASNNNSELSISICGKKRGAYRWQQIQADTAVHYLNGMPAKKCSIFFRRTRSSVLGEDYGLLRSEERRVGKECRL